MASFDPYRKWLGIPEQFRPPTHYQLLGILPEEQDREAIETAVIRQSVYVRNFQKGPNSDAATRLLNEIAAAKNCLIDPVKRAAYDASLPAANKPAAAVSPPVAPAAPASPPRRKRRAPARALGAEEMGIRATPVDPLANLLAATAVETSQRVAPPPRRKLSDPLVIGGAATVLLVGGLLGVIIVSPSPSGPPSEPVATASPVARTQAESSANDSRRAPATADAETAKPAPVAGSPTGALSPTAASADPSQVASTPAPASEPASPAQPPAAAQPLVATPSGEPTTVCMNILATDNRHSRSDAGADKNVYTLISDESIDPRTTEIQFRMNAADNSSAGEVAVETGGGTWRKVGEWTPKSLAAHAPDGGWDRLRLDQLQRKTPLRQIKVRLASAKGAKAADVWEVKWALSPKNRDAEPAGVEPAPDQAESEPGQALSDLLAADKHTGQTGGSSWGNIYTLAADQPADLRSTALRYHIGVYNPITIGEISIQLDDGKWRQIGRWTPRSVNAALAKDGWTQLRLDGLPAPTPARAFKVRFQYTGGGNVLDFHECQWWRTGAEAVSPAPETARASTLEMPPTASDAPQAPVAAQDPAAGEYTASSIHCLAFDDHYGAAGGQHEKNIYTLTVGEPIDLRSTEIRYQARAGQNSSAGEISIDTGGGVWKKIDQWSPQSLAAHADKGGWNRLRLDSAPRKGPIREVKIRFEYKGGGSALEIYQAQWCLPFKEPGGRGDKATSPNRSATAVDAARPRLLATDEHRGLTGAQHTDNVYSLSLPAPLDPRSAFLRFRIEADGDSSFGDIAIDTGDGQWRQVGGWTEQTLAASRASGGWTRLRLDGLLEAPPISEIKARFSYRGGGNLLNIFEVQCWSLAENGEK